ncbi:hypothetical protein R1flu_002892 [Riccia fluitans]|uniref:DNA-directed DNA polymerase n=1 Tax=Riccia fluitans TaxID=41844 RepID=A0ABD1YAE7_9MARC
MEQRQGTIDQHFRLRKRKYESPSKAPAFKASNDVLYEGDEDQSPVKKGSLESFVVTTKRKDASGSAPLSDARILPGSPGTHGAHLWPHEPEHFHSKNRAAGEAEKPGTAGLTAVPVADLCDGTDTGDGQKLRVGNSRSPNACAVYSRRKQKADAEVGDDDTLHLTQFASDFLSNYFSVLPSSDGPKPDTAQNFRKKRKDWLYPRDVTPQKKSCQLGRCTKSPGALQSEKETQSVSEQSLTVKLGPSSSESEEQQSARFPTDADAPEEFLNLVSLRDSQPMSPSPAKLKTASEGVASELKTIGTPSELALTEILSSESGQDSVNNEVTGGISCSKVMNTPSVDSEAVDGLNGRPLHTPQTFALQKGPSPSNISGGLYRTSLFSPGDDFWNEAIEVAGSLLNPNIHEAGDRGGVPKNDEVNPSEGGKAVGNAKDGTDGLNLMTGPKLQDDLFVGKEVEQMVKEFKNFSDVGYRLESEPLTVQQERVKDVKPQTRPYEFFSKSVKDGSVRAGGGWRKNLAASPLPVRHFDFSGARELQDLGDASAARVDRENVGVVPNRQNTVPSGTSEVVQVKDVAGHSAVGQNSILETDGRDFSKPAKNLDTGNANDIQVKPTLQLPQQDVGESTPTSSSGRFVQELSLEISAWVPEEVGAVYAKKGLTNLYRWQMECLQIKGVLEGKNLIYSASTSAGKSLVAELLMVKRIIATGRLALFVLPFVSICSEKAEHFEAVLEPLGKRVGSYYGTQGSATLQRDISIAVCTIEKANSLVNKMLEEGRLSEIGMIVIDELHMVGDRERGYLLELLLTKIRFACGEIDNIHDDSQEKVPVRSSPFQRSCKGDSRADLQIVGMSATMPNISAVAHWLQAELYVTDFRPVPLEEFIKVGSALYKKNMEIARNIRKGADCGGKDPDHVVELCHEVVREGNSVLVFCSSRKACETTAQHIAKYLPTFSPAKRGETNGFTSGAEAVEELRKSASGLDPVLGMTLPAGVAYHHAGLTMEERDVVEQCFKQGVVRVLTATSTLAAGVNLPARRVIFRQPKVGRDFLDGTRYRQMSGRAGRAGIDSKGESVLICKPEEVKRMTSVITAGCEPLQSCLTNDKIGMMRALLEVVAGGMVQTPQDVHRYVRCTLFNSTESFDHVVKGVQDALRWLCTKKFVEWNTDTETYSTTPLGRAAFGSSLTPEESLIVFEDLAKAREGFVLASDLHLVYQVTPIHVELEPDWSIFYQKFVELSHLEQTVGNRVGVMEPFLMRMAHGAPVQLGARGKSPRSSRVGLLSPYNHGGRQQSMDNLLRICRRFYVALMLSKLVQELPLMEVSESFKVPRGTVQALQGSAGRFAAMVTGFCQRLGWHDLEGLVSKFQSRVSFGVKAEIVELTEIPFVKGSRARGLYKAGLRTIQAVAEATMPELVKALSDSIPWAAQDESRRAVQQRVLKGIARKIKNGAQRIVIDRAEEARIAAFSAMRALGVDASALSVPVKMVNTVTIDEDDALLEKPISEQKLLEPRPVAESVQENIKLQRPGSSSTAGAHTLPGAPDQSLVVTLAADSSKQDNKENEGKTVKPEDAVKTKAMVSSANVEPVIQKFKVAAQVEVEGAAFSGVDIFKGRSPNKPHDERHGAAGKVTSGPVDVDKLPGGFDSFYESWSGAREFVFDLNYRNYSTDSLVDEYELEGIAICWEGSPVYYIRLTNLGSPIIRNVSQEKEGLEGSVSDDQEAQIEKLIEIHTLRWRKVFSVFRKSSVRKISWNLKDQIRALRSPVISIGKVDEVKDAGPFKTKRNTCRVLKMPPIPLEEPFLDVRITAWLLWPDEESSHSLTLEQEVKKRLPGEIAANANRAGRWANQMGRVSHNGCCRRAAQSRALHSVLWKLLVSEGLDKPLLIEMPLVKVLVSMELSGIGVDMDACSRTRKLLEQRLRELEAKAHRLAGISFSLSLPADVANVLYKHLKLPVPAGCPMGKHHPSTNKQTLELLKEQHPVAAVIQEHRKLSKLLHSTLSSIITWAKSPGTSGVSGSVHQIFGRWLHTSTATGRLSMEEPNLQCVENTISIDEDQGSQQPVDAAAISSVEIKARELFVPTQDGWVLLSADYSQIEVRLMAHFAEDAAMIDLLSRPSGDLFRLIAAQWTGQTEESVTSKQREQTKRLVYGILYGMGVQTLAEHLEASLSEASLYLERFRAAFPGITSWLNQALIDCRQRGYVVTLGGRKRFLEKINNGSYSEQARAGRQTANTICQGSAADLIKMAMVKLHSTIYGDDGPSNSAKIRSSNDRTSPIKGRCRMLLQIHDELVLEVDKTALKEVSEAVRSCMEGAASLKVPLRVKVQVGSNWGSLKPLEL